MPRLAMERVTRGLRWTGSGLLVAGAVVVVVGIGFTRSVEALMASAAIAALALGLPAAAAFTLAMWLERVAERMERPVEPRPATPAPPRNPFREPLRRYAIALGAVLVAWGLREALNAYVPGQVPFVTFYLAVAVAAWAGGFGPAALATMLGLLISAYFYVTPDLPQSTAGIARFVLLGLFVLVCLGIAAITATLREALARTQQLVDELRRRAETQTGGDHLLRLLAQSAPVPLFTTDRMLACTFCNKAWLGLRGRTLTQELGHGWLDGVHPDDLVRVRDARNAVLADERPATFDYRLRLADGTFAQVRESVDICRDARGACIGLVGACQAAADTALRD